MIEINIKTVGQLCLKLIFRIRLICLLNSPELIKWISISGRALPFRQIVTETSSLLVKARFKLRHIAFTFRGRKTTLYSACLLEYLFAEIKLN